MYLPSAADIQDATKAEKCADSHTYASIFNKLYQASHNPAWQLLSNIFDFYLRPSDDTEPFGPIMEMEGKRTMIPSDLSKEQLDEMKSLLKSSKDPEIKARLGDILWLQNRDVDAAKNAVQSYLLSGQNLEQPSWPRAMERYERAIRLARQLGKGGSNLFEQATQHLLDRVKQYGSDDSGYFTLKGIKLLHELKIGDPHELAMICRNTAQSSFTAKNFRRAADYYILAISLLRRANMPDFLLKVQEEHLDCMIEEATTHEVPGSFLAAHGFWSDVVKASREIPTQKHRTPEFHKRMNAAGKNARGDMSTISVEGGDASKFVQEAQEKVQGLPLDDAIVQLVSFSLVKADYLRQMVETSGFSIIDHIPMQIMDGAGRKVGIRPSILTDNEQERELAIQGIMQQRADVDWGIRVAVSIKPALHKILEEHHISATNLAQILEDSALIPEGRAPLFVKGILAGFEGDFTVATHLLIPQLEHALRVLLYETGTITEKLDSAGIESSWNLTRILNAPGLEACLGRDFVYELKLALDSVPGHNHRNLIFHGLLPSESMESDLAINIWWLTLKLVVLYAPVCQSFIERQKLSKSFTSEAK